MNSNSIDKSWDEAAKAMRFNGARFTNTAAIERGMAYIEWNDNQQRFVGVVTFEMGGKQHALYSVGINTKVARLYTWQQVNCENCIN